ncbi:MAG TPA: hypothetical protein VJL35_02075 [Gemmatimonadaceae bacterium]|nr:hypothetical protein [Gemmatimonadaceae bacterium]
MRLRLLLALPLGLILQGCWALESLGGRCPQEQLVVTWPVTITRGTATTSPLLTATLTPTSISQSQFNTLRQALTQDVAPNSFNVVWTVPASATSGGFISFAHAAPLTEGTATQVTSTFTGGGWSAAPFTQSPSGVSVNADNFVATSATGTITSLDTNPVRLRIDVTATSASGETMHLTGDAGFHYEVVTASCVTL